MSDNPIDYGHSRWYLVALFLAVVLLSFFALDYAQHTLLSAIHDPVRWLLLSTLFTVVISIPVVLLIWKMRSNISVPSIPWDFRDREVSFAEFRRIVEDYTSAYETLISRFHGPSAILCLALGTSAVVIPISLMTFQDMPVLLTPYLFAFLELLYLIVLARLVFTWMPIDSHTAFPYVSVSCWKRSVHLLERVSLFSWIGISVRIGHWKGYYTIRNPIAVARIENIESASRIEIIQDSDCRPVGAFAEVDINPKSKMKFERQLTKDYEIVDLFKLTRTILVHYIEQAEGGELLDDLLHEADSFLASHTMES